jgi:2-keto-3-deoxy-L-rhamnonate aldolase RhmA
VEAPSGRASSKDIPGYFMKSFINENMVLATQIENADAVENLESILCKSLAQAAHMFKRGIRVILYSSDRHTLTDAYHQ